jgi:hypothetical protein
MTPQNQLGTMLECASKQELTQMIALGVTELNHNQNLSKEDRFCLEALTFMAAVETESRGTEPLWRKTKRFVNRNADVIKDIGKIAAGVTVGVVLGGSISD